MKRIIAQISTIFASIFIGTSVFAADTFTPYFGIYGEEPYAFWGYYGCQDGLYYFISFSSYPFDGSQFDPQPQTLISPPDGSKYSGTLCMPDSVVFYSDGTRYQEEITGLADALDNSDVEELVLNNIIYEVNVSDAQKLKKITVTSGNSVFFGKGYFANTAIEKITSIPGVETRIGINEAFVGCASKVFDCSGCNGVYLSSWFLEDSNIERLILPSTVEVEYMSFANCPNLKSIYFKGNVKKESAFSIFNPNTIKCANLEELIYDFEIPHPLTQAFHEFTEEQLATIRLYVPDESVELYRQAEVWKDFKNILPKSQWNSVSDIQSDDHSVVSEDYYDLQGRPVDSQSSLGIIIKRTTYSDGKVSVTKQFNRQ